MTALRSSNRLADRLTGEEMDRERESRRDTPRRRRALARRAPTNSLGQPWQPGQRWVCDDCGESGDDRDDVPHSQCSAQTGASKPHLGLRFEPAEHEAAFQAKGRAMLRRIGGAR